MVMEQRKLIVRRFSGDTEPTDRLVRAAKGVTLLIHEATMSDDEVEIARAKKHSTFAEAIDIGTRYVHHLAHAIGLS